MHDHLFYKKNKKDYYNPNLLHTSNSDISALFCSITHIFDAFSHSFFSDLITRPTSHNWLTEIIECVPKKILYERMRVVQVILKQRFFINLTIKIFLLSIVKGLTLIQLINFLKRVKVLFNIKKNTCTNKG